MKDIRKDNFPLPNKEDIKKAIDNSGYVFELQLCPLFGQFEYIANSSVHFQDQDTGKSREIDIHASKYIWSNNQSHPDDKNLMLSDTLRIDIIAECKNNRAPVVFFTRKPSLKHYAELLVAGNPELIKNVDGIPEDGLVDIQDFLKFEEFHHHWQVVYPSYQFGLMKPKYQGKGSKQEIIEWTLTHEDYYESLEKLIKAAFAKGQDIYEQSLYYEINEIYLSIMRLLRNTS